MIHIYKLSIIVHHMMYTDSGCFIYSQHVPCFRTLYIFRLVSIQGDSLTVITPILGLYFVFLRFLLLAFFSILKNRVLINYFYNFFLLKNYVWLRSITNVFLRMKTSFLSPWTTHYDNVFETFNVLKSNFNWTISKFFDFTHSPRKEIVMYR